MGPVSHRTCTTIILFMLCILFLTGLSGGCAKREVQKKTDEKQPVKSAWCVYWDQDGISRFEAAGNYRQQILFACYYREDGSVYMPQKLKEMAENAASHRNSKVRRYLSFVNDVLYEDGTAAQKEAWIVQKLLADPGRQAACAKEMLAVAKEAACQGVEVDFEKIRSDTLWQSYLSFIEILQKLADEEQMAVRIVLGVDTPAEQLAFPEGPDYVVMAYNLYGYHSGPGPKADIAFVREQTRRFLILPSLEIALANGGFDWDADGNVTEALTVTQAKEKAEQYVCRPVRDEKSGALQYSYLAEDGWHTVWYADEQTIQIWADAVRETADRTEPKLADDTAEKTAGETEQKAVEEDSGKDSVEISLWRL